MLFAIISITGFAQSRNFIDQPYLETTVKVDTLVVPDQILCQFDSMKVKTATKFHWKNKIKKWPWFWKAYG